MCNIVGELAIAAGMKPPQPMVLVREQGINAFAAAWNETDAVVAVTQGALDDLTRDELQALVAHEFSHLREGDIRLNMRLAGMVFGLERIFNPDRESRWFASHPPLAERIRRIYGRPMAALPARRDDAAVTRPDAIF